MPLLTVGWGYSRLLQSTLYLEVSSDALSPFLFFETLRFLFLPPARGKSPIARPTWIMSLL